MDENSNWTTGRICPLFSLMKESPHLCVKSSCAWWTDSGQCAVAQIAENGEKGRE